MAFRPHEIPVLIASKNEADKEEAWKRILRAFVDAHGSRTRAASLLGCSRGTLAIWIAKLGIAQKLLTVEEILKRQGLHHGRRGGAGWHRNRRAQGETSEPF